MAKMDGKQDRAVRARRQFTPEFKAGAVRLVLDEGKTVAQVARDLGLTPSSLAGWVKQARADRSHGKTGLTSEERAELATLRKEVRRGPEVSPRSGIVSSVVPIGSPLRARGG